MKFLKKKKNDPEFLEIKNDDKSDFGDFMKYMFSDKALGPLYKDCPLVPKQARMSNGTIIPLNGNTSINDQLSKVLTNE